MTFKELNEEQKTQAKQLMATQQADQRDEVIDMDTLCFIDDYITDEEAQDYY